jgi:hypothetical protein
MHWRRHPIITGNTGILTVLARKLRNNDRKSNDFSMGYLVMSVVYNTPTNVKTDDQFTHMVVMPIDKFLLAFSEPKVMVQIIEGKTNDVIKEWGILNYPTTESVGSRTQTERMFTLFDHQWKTWGRLAQRSECVLQLQTWGYTELYGKDLCPPPMKNYDVKVSKYCRGIRQVDAGAAAAVCFPYSPKHIQLVNTHRIHRSSSSSTAVPLTPRTRSTRPPSWTS